MMGAGAGLLGGLLIADAMTPDCAGACGERGADVPCRLFICTGSACVPLHSPACRASGVCTASDLLIASLACSAADMGGGMDMGGGF